MSVFSIQAFPAEDGDALLITWGPNKSRLRRMLVDVGRKSAAEKVAAALKHVEKIDLLVLTHIDADHIEGALRLLNPKKGMVAPAIDAVWFNGKTQCLMARDRSMGRPAEARSAALSLPDVDRIIRGRTGRENYQAMPVLVDRLMRAVNQGNEFERLISNSGTARNVEFGGVISVGSPEGRKPVEFAGLKITLLSPTDDQLGKLAKVWQASDDKQERALQAAGPKSWTEATVRKLASQPEKPDTAVPNGSSIAFLAQYGSKTMLLAGDAHAETLVASLRALKFSETKRLKVDCFKVAHHGSGGNTSNELLRLLDCESFLISTNGRGHGHPDEIAIARMLSAKRRRGAKTKIYFNSPHPDAVWRKLDVAKAFGCELLFGDDDRGVTVDVLRKMPSLIPPSPFAAKAVALGRKRAGAAKLARATTISARCT